MKFTRKASFFAVTAAEAMSEIDADAPDDRASALWVHASKMLSKTGNDSDSGNYGWATLRAVSLHGLAMQGLRDSSEDAAVQLLSLMSEISPAMKPKESTGLFFSKLDAIESQNSNFNDSIRSDEFADNASYLAKESVVSAARSYVRDARDRVRNRGTSFFSGTDINSTLLAVAQSKWADDEPISPMLLPMSDFSDISNSIIAMRSVWSAIKFDHLATAQKKLIGQISDLRRNMPASSLPGTSSDIELSSLPLKITSIRIVESESHADFERVKVKRVKEDKGAMATFFNPYADKKGEDQTTIVAEGEELYILVKFANSLAVPLDVPRCQLEFDVPQSDRIKAPAISFIVPGQTNDFPVQFPFILLKGSGDGDSQADASNTMEIKGLYLTCLGRSLFLPLQGKPEESDSEAKEETPNLPDSASLYPRRNYKEKSTEKEELVKSPRLELIPSQPNLLISFATSPTPISEDDIIPAPLSDGENFSLPKLCLSNDSGISGLGKIEQLRITAVGLPGYSEIVLFDLTGDGAKKEEPKDTYRVNKIEAPKPVALSAHCVGLDDATLNTGSDSKHASSVLLQLSATPDMGAHTKECTVTIRFRYRGQVPSSDTEFWRKREVKIRILRIKGPRISSLTFRPDLSWESSYSELCKTLSDQDKHKRYRPSRVNQDDLPHSGSTDDEEFVMNRLGKDPGVHVCGDKVAILLAVSNETTSPIHLSRPSGALGGFEGSPLETILVSPGVAAKIPMIVPRVDRAPEIADQLTKMTMLEWKSEASMADEDSTETGGTMVPVNTRVRKGKIQIPPACLKAIIDENPTFLSRICKAPCTINVGVAGGSSGQVEVKLGKPVDTSVGLKLADWIPSDVLKQSSLTLEFCCARKGASKATTDTNERDYVWCGQIRKALPKDEKEHSHRARLVFLQEGDYVVSACVSFSRTDIDDDVKETWWAEKAQHIRVQEMPPSQ